MVANAKMLSNILGIVRLVKLLKIEPNREGHRRLIGEFLDQSGDRRAVETTAQEGPNVAQVFISDVALDRLT